MNCAASIKLTPYVLQAALLAFCFSHALPAQSTQSEYELPSKYEQWLDEDVRWIITPEERTMFRGLTSNEDRDRFIERFWKRRDPTPGTPENEFKEEHYRRIAYANIHFASAIAGWKTDRGRIYITYGPPDEKESHPNGNKTSPVPFEQWLYHFIDGVGTNVVIEFVDPNNTGEYRMT